MSGFDYEVECPECGASFAVPRIRTGRPESCPVCRTAVVVPGPGESATALPKEPQQEAPSGPQPPRAGRRAAGPARSLVGPGEGGRCLVCLASERKINPVEVGAIVESFAGLSRTEARMQVHQGMGILAEELSPDTAHHMLEKLRQKDIEACVVPAEVPARLGKDLPAVRIHGADEAALHVEMDRAGTVKAAPWNTLLTGVCFLEDMGGRTSRLESRDEPTGFVGISGMGAGVYRRRMSGLRVTSERREPELRVALVLLRGTTGELYRLRFGEDQVRYAYLGDRMRSTRRENLGELLADVMDYAPGAFFPDGFRAAASGSLQRARQVTCRLEADNYVRWAVCAAAARGLLDSTETH